MKNLKDVNNIKSNKRTISLSPKNYDYKINRSFNSSPMNLKNFKLNTPKMIMETNSDREKVEKTSSTASIRKSFYSKEETFNFIYNTIYNRIVESRDNIKINDPLDLY